MPVTCIVLAAGASKRLRRPKQLAEVDGQPLIARAVRVAAAVAPTIVVVPPDGLPAARAIREILDRLQPSLPLRIVENPDWSEGMASSIRAGVAAAEGDVVITLCDQPRITPAHLRALVAAGSPIAATGYSGIAGVPVFFAAEFRNELLALRGESGARSVVEAHRSRTAVIPFDAARFDLDTDADFSL